jgi:predicted esterase YcpF (UPF0227 family)
MPMRALCAVTSFFCVILNFLKRREMSMTTLVYIHGFLSSPQSTKAVQTQKWLKLHRPKWSFECPFLSAYPDKAKTELDHLMQRLTAAGEEVFIIGSSLGGFWATYLVEQFSVKAVVVNPSVKPISRMKELVGQTIKNYYTDDCYTLSDDDIKTLKRCSPVLLHDTNLYWLMSQKGDEVLDYRDGVERFQGCRQTIEDGGNHSFEGFESWIPEVIRFFENE